MFKFMGEDITTILSAKRYMQYSAERYELCMKKMNKMICATDKDSKSLGIDPLLLGYSLPTLTGVTTYVITLIS